MRWRQGWLVIALLGALFLDECRSVHGYHQSADPYATLGVSRGASEDQIKRAYKKLAIKYHPDKNSHGNQEAAKEKFVRVQEAYEALTSKRPSSSPQSQYSSYRQQEYHHQNQYSHYHHHHHQQQQQQYYHYTYSSQQRPPSSGLSSILYFFVLGIVAMLIYTKVMDDPATTSDTSRPPSQQRKASPRAQPPPPKPSSSSPFASLAAKYAPHVPELTPALLQVKGRRVVIFCMRGSPSHCSPLAQWIHAESAAEEFKNDPAVAFAWCDVESGPQMAKWTAFFDTNLIDADSCVVLAVSNQSKYVTFNKSADLSYSDLQVWLSRLVGGEGASPKQLQASVPV